MAVMWITHDLGVVAGLVSEVNVMYAGYIIERGDVKNIYGQPRHPYTRGLLGSLPRLDEPPGTKLISIPGLPPDLIDLPPGCPFAARCIYAVEQVPGGDAAAGGSGGRGAYGGLLASGSTSVDTVIAGSTGR